MITAFVSGFLVEVLNLLWVHFAEKNHYVGIFFISILCGTAYLLGLGEAIGHWRSGIAWVFGFSLGPLAGIWIKKRFLGPPPENRTPISR